MLANWQPSVRRVLQHEGGYVNHPADPGGPTNFGITIYDYRRYINPRATADDVRAMKLSEAMFIYKTKYWDALKCDDLEPGVDYSAFDYGVNSGIGRAGRVLRRIVHLPDTTSILDAQALRVINSEHADYVVKQLYEERINFLHHLSTWPIFGGGWGRRVNEVEQYALSIAQDLPVVDAPSVAPANGRAIEPSAFMRVRALQTMLARAGFDPGAIDGDLGPKTIKAFQRYEHLQPVDGIVGNITRPLLDKVLAGIPPLMETHS